jgi:DNA-binding NarL/FixJ family response regulator
VTTQPLRVLIVDDHPVIITGLKTLLGSSPATEVVGATMSGEEGIELAGQLLPDVVVMDVRLPGIDGVEATRRLVAASPSIAVLMLTMFDDDETVFASMRAGARGYLLKGASQEDLIGAIVAVARGEAIFGPAIADRVLRYFASPARSQALPFPALTVREREVLHLVASGHSNLVIARQLSLSGKTVANHVSNILAKLQAADRAEAIVQARRAGLGE